MKVLKGALIGLVGFLCAGDNFAETVVRCGEIVEGEFTKAGEGHVYKLSLDPGTKLDLLAVPLGTTLKTHIKLFEPAGNIIQVSNTRYGNLDFFPNESGEFVSEARVNTEPLSARGIHTIKVYNWSAGVYSLYVNCVFRDGTEKKAGSQAGEEATAEPFEQPYAAQETGVAPGLQMAAGTAPEPAAPAAGAKDMLTGMAADAATNWVAGKLNKSAGGDPSQPSAAPAPAVSLAEQLIAGGISALRKKKAAPAPAPPPVDQPAPPVRQFVPQPMPASQVATQPAVRQLDMAMPSGLTLYSDSGFAGNYESFRGNDDNLRDNAIGNDKASSLRVDPSCVATLYADANFNGKSLIVKQDIVNLRDTPLGNDSVSSIRVHCSNGPYF